MKPESNALAAVVSKGEADILEEWVRLQRGSAGRRSDLMDDQALRDQSRQLLGGLRKGLESGGTDVSAAGWGEARETLGRLSRERARLGFTARETANFVLSLKQALQPQLRGAVKDPAALAEETWRSSTAIDALAVLTMDEFQKGREEVITRQQQDLLELSTPVVQLWQGVLALPLIGTLDSARTQVVMENLLQAIVDTERHHRHHRHHRRAHRGHPGRAAPAEDGGGGAAHGRGLHHQRHPAPDRADHRAPRGGAGRGRHQGQPRGRVRPRAAPQRPRRHRRARPPEALMERIPILKMGRLLLITIQVDMHDRLAMTLQDDLMNQIRKSGATGVLIDISALDVVDSFIGRMLANIAAMARILDADTVVTGMRPAVAITLVELGLSLPGVRTALNVERGMELLQSGAAGGKGPGARPQK